MTAAFIEGPTYLVFRFKRTEADGASIWNLSARPRCSRVVCFSSRGYIHHIGGTLKGFQPIVIVIVWLISSFNIIIARIFNLICRIMCGYRSFNINWRSCVTGEFFPWRSCLFISLSHARSCITHDIFFERLSTIVIDNQNIVLLDHLPSFYMTKISGRRWDWMCPSSGFLWMTIQQIKS